jgi:hypothetical protein
MLRTRLTVDARGTIAVVFPKNGQRNRLRVRFGSTAHEQWMPVSSARQLYAALGARLAELDAGSTASSAARPHE